MPASYAVAWQSAVWKTERHCGKVLLSALARLNRQFSSKEALSLNNTEITFG